MKAFTPEQEKELEAWTAAYPYPMMGLIEAMRQVQEWHLHISPSAEEHLARLFSTSVAHVHEVATFFPFFTQKPTGRTRIGVCRTLSCALAGSERVVRHLAEKLRVAPGEPTKDGAFSYEEMECLGACDHAPALLVNEELLGQASEHHIDLVLQGHK